MMSLPGLANRIVAKIAKESTERFYPVYRWRERRAGFRPRVLQRSELPEFADRDGRSIDVQSILEELWENGAVALPMIISDASIGRLLDQSEEIRLQHERAPYPNATIFDQKFGFEPKLVSQGISRFYGFDRQVPDAIEFRDHPLIRFVCEAYYGRPLRLETLIYQHNRIHDRGTRNWHIDSWLNQIKPFLYLSDVGEGNGPFTYLLKSHRNEDRLLRKTFRCAKGLESTDVSDEIVRASGLKAKEFYGPRGTVLIADTKGFHQGGTLSRGTRSSLTSYLYV